MISVNKIETGIARYLDAELMPKLPSDGLKSVVVGTAISIVIKRMGAALVGLHDNTTLKALGIVAENGDIDIDLLHDELRKHIPRTGLSIDIPFVGTLRFTEGDVDNLYNYIVS